MCLWSEKIPISVGTNQEIFRVDKSLLILHSGFFRNKFSDLDEQEDERKGFSLPNVDPACFVDFVCWMRRGEILTTVSQEVMYPDSSVSLEKQWLLGQFLEAPGFQNWVTWIGLTGYWEKQEHSQTPIEEVRFLYELPDKVSKLRRFYADFVACQNPFQKYREKDPEYEVWRDLFKEFPELALDVLEAGAKKNDKFPWDHTRIGDYMEDEPDLNQVWEEMILKARPLAQIEENARNGCIRSKIELDHIMRNQVVEEEGQ
jgi:BTB/POZ domain